MLYDAAIIGAGPAGLLCARDAARRGLRVALIDSHDQPGAKLAIAGGGKGNITNRILAEDRYVGEDTGILRSALKAFSCSDALDLLRELKSKINGSIMLITHDLGVIAEMADYVVVMYAGKVIERGTASEIFHDPRHPYTIGLQKSKPTLDSDSDTLFNIPGNVLNPVNMPNYCYFKERCGKCVKKCSGDYPGMVQVSPTHFVACHLYEEEK